MNVAMSDLDWFICISWMVFWLYWLVSSMHTKRNSYNGRSAYLGFRLGIILVVLLLFRVYHLRSGFWSGVFQNHPLIPNSLALQAIGAVVLAAGLLFAVWARVHLGRNWGMPMTQKKEPELITSGPYHFARHPIYTGILFAALGTAIAMGIPWLVLFASFGVYFIFSAYQEEAYLEKQFGEVYVTYRKSTKMLIPFVF